MEEKLIEAVRGRQILYDTSHKDYLKSKLKTQIWDEVAKEIGMPSGSEAKTVWEKLRHSLRDALRRQNKCMKSGAAATTLKLWKFQTEMGFLQPYMMNRKRESNLIDSDEDSTAEHYEQMEREDGHESDSVVESVSVEHQDERMTSVTATYFPENSQDNASKNLNPKNLTDSPSFSREDLRTPKKQFKKKDNVTMLLKQSLENRVKRTADRAEERALLLNMIPPTGDPLYHLFMSMYETTKSMPPASQHQVKNQIYKAVTDMEATLLQMSQTHTHSVPQFNQYDLQHERDPYSVSQCPPSTPHSSYSDNSSHHSSITAIQSAPPEYQEERDIVTLINQFSEK